MKTDVSSGTVDVGALASAEEKAGFSQDQALGNDVYDFLYKASAQECNVKLVFGGARCGKCLVCQAKALEEKLHARCVQIGRLYHPCASCKGTGVKKTKGAP